MKKFILTCALIGFSTLGSNAGITVEQNSDAEYLLNSGFSEALVEDVFMLKNRATGKPVEPLYEKSQNKLVKGWKWLYAYFDPAQDKPDRLHHDIKLAPSPSDL